MTGDDEDRRPFCGEEEISENNAGEEIEQSVGKIRD